MNKKLAKMSAYEIVAHAEDYAQRFKKDRLKTNQIRNFYAAVTALRTDFQEIKSQEKQEGEAGTTKTLEDIQWELTMLKPKLAYAAGRQAAVKYNFYPFMKKAIEDVEGEVEEEQKKIAFKHFFALIESVVGYHKFYGDK